MRLSDQFGYDVTLADREALASWNAAVTAFLAHGRTTPVHLADALARAPDFALGHAARGLFLLLLARRELVAPAREALRSAERAQQARPVTRREVAVTAALRDWLDGWPSAAADRLDRALAEAPTDAFLLKLVHAIRFLIGDARGMRASIEAVLPAYREGHPAFGYVLGCHAFALEETGDHDRAERAGRRGLGLAPDDAWGLHAVAHVHDMTGRAEDGIRWLEAHPHGWAHCNNFGYHVWWHLALLHLDRGDTGKALELYDMEIRRERTDDFRDIANAVSLLVRLELAGVDAGTRWEDLAQLSDRRAEDGCSVFADLHYLMALQAGGRRPGAERLIAGLARRAAETEGDMARAAARAGLPTALALEQYRKGNYASAYFGLLSVREALPAIGGSHAQRDVFERLTVEAALRAGLAHEAEDLLADRTRRRGGLDGFAECRLEICARMRRAALVMQDERLRAGPG
ncbi:tetratricopeptide repeat protein [Polymorphum gilvum]|uniref:Tetratricopeptide repeat protein 38 n=1 Tax=Polymorphum gilvum (strain LMG 25793 / CGMCC 1.9160 / SL003B-26A1) TaxID=991905 RepID=F2J6V5_POLGS|nr:tetratricopeptide repeat protein [Polymorphum gilvum]ADZ72588.1 Tetratricopeptide repeat domain protein [Polymorphum gilvum SL003B-26A1]